MANSVSTAELQRSQTHAATAGLLGRLLSNPHNNMVWLCSAFSTGAGYHHRWVNLENGMSSDQVNGVLLPPDRFINIK